PCQFSVRGDPARKFQICWRRGGPGQLSQGFGIVQGNISHECKIEIFSLVAVFFKRLRKSYSGQSSLVKNVVVPAAAQPVYVKNQPDCGTAVDFFDGAREFTGGRIVVVHLACSGKKTDAMRGTGGQVGSNDVVVEHSPDGIALLLH